MSAHVRRLPVAAIGVRDATALSIRSLHAPQSGNATSLVGPESPLNTVFSRFSRASP